MSFAPGTQLRAESLGSNLGHGANNNRSSIQSNSNGSRPRSTSSSKALLTLALMEAQTAVQLDNDSDITGALEAYQRAVTLLNRVMNTTSSPDEQDRLRTIHDSYLFRIQLLSTPPTPITPSHSSPEDLQKGDPPRDIDHQLSPPASDHPSSHSPHHDREGPDPTATIPTGLSFQANLPSPRRGKKLSPSPLQPSESQVPDESNGSVVNRPRQRSDSASVLTGGGRRHVRTHTGGSVARSFTGDLVSAAEQLQIHAQRMVPKVRSKDVMDVPLHLAPTIPLPPTPNSAPPAKEHQGPLSPPLLVPGPPSHNPPAPNLSANQTFLASLAVNTHGPRSQSPTSPPPRTTLPQIPSNLSSTLPNDTRRTSPLVPSYLNSSLPLPPLPKSSTLLSAQASLVSPGSSPEQQKQHREEEHSMKVATDLHSFYSDAALMPDEWLPTLSSKEITVSDVMFDQAHTPASFADEDPAYSRNVSLKGAYTHDAMVNERRVYEKDKDGNYVQQDAPTAIPPLPITATSRTSYQHRHQRSYSHSSLSRGDTTESHAHQPVRSPLSGQLSTSQPGSPILSQHKRNSDSNRASFKEGVMDGSGSNSPSPLGRTSRSHNNSPVGFRQAQQPQQRSGILRHHSSFSKLSGSSTAVSTNSSNSSNAEKSSSPSMGHGSNGGMVGLPAGLLSGGTTLFEVMADDPFGGMTFPLPPPPALEPPPADQYFRAFWLMRRLEQTMTQGGFLTRRLFVPRTIWYQSQVRLPAAESKTSACLTLQSLLNKMDIQSQRGHLTLMVEPGGGADGDQDRTLILRELEALEAATVQIQNKLSKKFSFIHRPGKHPGHPPVSTGFSAIPGSGALSISTQHHHAGHPHQEENPLSPDGHDDHESSIATTPVTSPIRKSAVGVGLAGGAGGMDTASLKNQWKNFSKSVQKSMGNDKVEDSSAYTDSVVSLFQSSYILEDMLKHYNALSPFQTHIQIINRLRRLSEFLYFVVCAFVVRDLSELMSRYLKRVGTWVNE
ncbi:hypothetical protein CPB97_010931 [Podila verticillata]|nr:hypothetical protein CPB97_010931 [Podila verticillata]